jgi:hypothetical protein
MANYTDRPSSDYEETKYHRQHQKLCTAVTLCNNFRNMISQ